MGEDALFVRTICLSQYISDAKLRESSQQTTNKVEQFNACRFTIGIAARGKQASMLACPSARHLPPHGSGVSPEDDSLDGW